MFNAVSRTLMVRRCPANPLITGENVNGPSVISVPGWIEDPLGKYYMYFADHAGDRIKLAYADDPAGPWTVHLPGTLRLEEAAAFQGHIASPDVHVDNDIKRIRMYFHGPAKGRKGQWTGVAVSSDGLRFEASERYLGKFYFRVFEYGGFHYALAKDGNSGWGKIYRSSDGMGEFENGGRILKRVRHTAVKRNGDILSIFYSRKGDAPERIMLTTVDLTRSWRRWKARRPVDVLRPELPYEGSEYPNIPSKYGPAVDVRQLRDPCVFEDGGRTYLFYSIAGERGIAMAELREAKTLVRRILRRAVGTFLAKTARIASSPRLGTLIYCMGTGNMGRYRRISSMNKNPVIIGGCGRSGTTLLLSVLSCHPRIFCIDGERQPFCPTAYSGKFNPEAPFRMDRLLPPILEGGMPVEAVRWCEKTPKNVLFIRRILEYFGEGCRFIHVVRDGRDVITSRHPDDPSRYWVSPGRWVDDVSAGLAFRDHPQVHTVRYEDLVLDYGNTVRRVCDFLGEAYAPEFDSFPETARVATLARVTMGHQTLAVHAESVGRWRKPEFTEAVAGFLEYPGAVDILERLGYTVEDSALTKA